MKDRITDFGAFVKAQQTGSSEAAPVDWVEERERWLRNLNDLYEKIESSLQKYIEAAEIKCEYKPLELSETDIGTYYARQMTIKIGRQEINFVPIGTMLIAMRGCVEIVGRGGKSSFVLVDKDATRIGFNVTVRNAFGQTPAVPEPPKKINWAWKIATGAPANQFIELTDDSIFQVLMNVSGR